jgi:hypothetical protein
LYHIADWLARTVLVQVLGVPAAKFNDDRLGRTLDAIQPHSQEIWQDVVQRALVQAEVDLNLISAILNMGEGSVHQEAERAFCGVIVGQRLTRASEKKADMEIETGRQARPG